MVNQCRNFKKITRVEIGIAITVGLILISAFSPIMAYVASIMVLFMFSKILERWQLRWVGFISCFSGSVVAASRKVFVVDSDDFIRYYDAYLEILREGLGALDIFNYEIGLFILYYFISKFGVIDHVLLLFAAAFLPSIVFVYWVDKIGSKYFQEDRFGSVLAISMVFFNFFLATQLTRQFISSCFLLLAIFSLSYSYRWLVVATAFHFSAIPMYVVSKLILRFNWVGLLFAVAIAMVSVLNFEQIMQWVFVLSSSFDVSMLVANKFIYYTENNIGFTDADLGVLKLFLGVWCISLLSFRAFPKNWFRLVSFFFVCYIVLLPIPLASLRVTLLVHGVLAGYLVAFFAYIVGWRFVESLGLTLLFYRIAKMMLFESGSPFGLWDGFETVNYIPFYYFVKF